MEVEVSSGLAAVPPVGSERRSSLPSCLHHVSGLVAWRSSCGAGEARSHHHRCAA